LRGLAKERVRTEAHGGVSCLASSGRDESLKETANAAFAEDDRNGMEETAHSGGGGFPVVDPGGLVLEIMVERLGSVRREMVTYKVVLILSNGVTANKLSVNPAPKPAMTVLGPEI
jgi:hypothetical protein